MSALFGKIWQGLAGLGAVAAGVLYAMYRIADAQKGKAQEKAKRARDAAAASEAARTVEHRVDENRAAARERAASVEQDLNQREQAGKRPPTFGDPRLRSKDEDSQ